MQLQKHVIKKACNYKSMRLQKHANTKAYDYKSMGLQKHAIIQNDLVMLMLPLLFVLSRISTANVGG